MNHEVRCFFSV